MNILEMKHITKRFGALAANDDISLSVKQGEVHALLGENGAGKSTLMNILYGMYENWEGEVYLSAKPVRICSPKQAIELGIGMVHQHFMLIPALSVIENVVLGLYKSTDFLKLGKAAKEFSSLAESYGMKIDPFAKVATLSVGQRQRLEILKALYRKAKLLILDEPTAVLTPQEVVSLFSMVKKLTAQGSTVIFISHKLAEILDICDSITVLRQGRCIATLPVSQIESKEQLAQLMVGKEVELNTPKAPATPGEKVLSVAGLCANGADGRSALSDVSFFLRKGEILGVCGVDGNGQSELVKCVAGLHKACGGTIELCGHNVANMDPRHIIEKGVAHIPEDRHDMGIVEKMNLEENLMLMGYHKPPYSNKGLLDLKYIHEQAERICSLYSVKTLDTKEYAKNLSGGNQQKLVVGRELDRDPKLLIAMHPSRGLDIGATKYIQARIVEQRDNGAAVLLVSTELEELMQLSDRIMVMYGGRVMGIVERAEATVEDLGLMMAGLKKATPQAVSSGA